MLGMVKGHSKRDEKGKGKLLGHWRCNPMLDTSIYEVNLMMDPLRVTLQTRLPRRFIKGLIHGYLVDEIKDIVDHRTDGSAVWRDDAYIEVNGPRWMRWTTKGWKLLV